MCIRDRNNSSRICPGTACHNHRIAFFQINDYICRLALISKSLLPFMLSAFS